MICYGFGIKDYLFEAIKYILEDERINFGNNFQGSVIECLEKIKGEESPSIILTDIFTEEREIQAKELLISFRFQRKEISRSLFVIFSYTSKDKIPPIFKSDGCSFVQLPCEITNLLEAIKKEPISRKERDQFLSEYGYEFVQKQIQIDIASSKHRIQSKIRPISQEDNFSNIYSYLIDCNALKNSKEILCELINEYKNRYSIDIHRNQFLKEKIKEIKKINKDISKLENILSSKNKKSTSNRKQLKDLINYLSYLDSR